MWFVFNAGLPVAIAEITIRTGFMRWYWLGAGILSMTFLRWLRQKVTKPVPMTLLGGSVTVITCCVTLMGTHGQALIASAAIAIATIISMIVVLEFCDGTLLHGGRIL